VGRLGGWYDHVNPTAANRIGHGNLGYPGGGGNGVQYVYGFRVPLLVVGQYVKQTSQSYAGYISNANYDFGGILTFIENTFSLGGFIDGMGYPFADAFVLQPNNNLSDFFGSTQRAFTPIALSPLNCTVSCFENMTGNPEDPDEE